MYTAPSADLALLSAFDRAPVGLGVASAGLRYVRVNPALAEINGFTPDEHVGRRPSELLGDLGVRVERDLRRVLETGTTTVVDVSGRTPAQPDVERRWLTRLYPLGDGPEAGVGLLVVDVSDRYAAEQDRERLRRRAEFLASSAATLASSLDFDTTIRAVVDTAVPELGDWCACALLTGDRVELLALAHADPADAPAVAGVRARWPQPLSSRAAIPTAVRTGRAIVAPGDAFPALRALEDLGATSGLAVPLVSATGVVGALGLLHTRSGRTHGPEDLETAQALADRAAVAIAHARAHQAAQRDEARVRELYAGQKQIAETLQNRLLPRRVPEVPGVELATRYRAAGEHNQVGGDFYDVFRGPDGQWTALVGDVAGKGPEAAALTASIRQIVRTGTRWHSSAGELLRVVNDELFDDADARTCTLAHAALHEEGDRLRVVVTLAGHPPPFVLRRDGSVEAVGEPGTLLGGLPRIEVVSHAVRLGPGDLLLLYTDGALEVGRGRRAGELLDLRAVLAASAGSGAAEVVRRVEEAVVRASGGTPHDDIALVCLRRR